ncbi:MAG: PQQ-binding-like beta-propeller repeat protein [Pirellulales bacterium]|nr:PQQ-binding-like beta-propeller repeat protein [Pirellulales bacterium]
MPQLLSRLPLDGVLGLTILLAAAEGCAPATAEPPTRIAPLAAAPTTGQPEATVAWPGWRGPTGDGHAADAFPDPWPSEAPEPLWTTPTAAGWSSPVIDQGKVIVTEREDAIERVRALDLATGRELWRRENPVDFEPHDVGRRHGNGPKSTPAIAGDRVFTLGIAGWLQGLQLADGKPQWLAQLPARFGAREPLPRGRAYVNGVENVVVPVGDGQGAPVPLFGYTGSLLIAGKTVVLSVGGQQGGTLMAFDQATGEVLWKALDEHVSYSSPRLATLAGVEQVVAMTGPRVVGLALDDGRLLWSHPFQIQYDESISTPVISGNLVLVTGDGHPLTALEITAADAAQQARVAWTNRDLTSYLSSMLTSGEHVYGMNDGGEFVCAELSSGRTVWTGGSHGYYCTPVLAGKRILALNEVGRLAVVAAEAQAFRPLGENRLIDGATWSAPAVVGTRIVIRTDRDVRCFAYGQ